MGIFLSVLLPTAIGPRRISVGCRTAGMISSKAEGLSDKFGLVPIFERRAVEGIIPLRQTFFLSAV